MLMNVFSELQTKFKKFGDQTNFTRFWLKSGSRIFELLIFLNKNFKKRFLTIQNFDAFKIFIRDTFFRRYYCAT